MNTVRITLEKLHPRLLLVQGKGKGMGEDELKEKWRESPLESGKGQVPGGASPRCKALSGHERVWRLYLLLNYPSLSGPCVFQIPVLPLCEES